MRMGDLFDLVVITDTNEKAVSHVVCWLCSEEGGSFVRTKASLTHVLNVAGHVRPDPPGNGAGGPQGTPAGEACRTVSHTPDRCP